MVTPILLSLITAPTWAKARIAWALATATRPPSAVDSEFFGLRRSIDQVVEPRGFALAHHLSNHVDRCRFAELTGTMRIDRRSASGSLIFPSAAAYMLRAKTAVFCSLYWRAGAMLPLVP